MKALITAAGMGTRLGLLTEYDNKCLLKVANQSILKRSLGILNDNGITDIVIVTGHASDKVEKEFSKNARFIFNPFYRISGILASVWLGGQKIGLDDFVFITGDSIYHPSILKKCIQAKNDIVICVKKKPCDAEDSKVVIRKGNIVDIGKNIRENKATGEFMGMVKVSKKACKSFFNEVNILLKEGRLNGYVADALKRLRAKNVKISMIYTGPDPYIEIDNPEDLRRARKIFPG